MQQNRRTVLPAARLGSLVGLAIGYFLFGPDDVVRFTATVVTGALIGGIASSLRPERLLFDPESRSERWIQVAIGENQETQEEYKCCRKYKAGSRGICARNCF